MFLNYLLTNLKGSSTMAQNCRFTNFFKIYSRIPSSKKKVLIHLSCLLNRVPLKVLDLSQKTSLGTLKVGTNLNLNQTWKMFQFLVRFQRPTKGHETADCCYLAYRSKGQSILKCIFRYLQFFQKTERKNLTLLKVRQSWNDFFISTFKKKTNKIIWLYYYDTSFSFALWRKRKKPKGHFKIN